MSHVEYLCRLDTTAGTKDYLKGGRCVRFLGVRETEFNQQAMEAGVTTFTIDIDYWDSGLADFRHLMTNDKPLISYREENLEFAQRWFKIKLGKHTGVGNGLSYTHQTFKGDRPQFFQFVGIQPLSSGPTIPPPQASDPVKRGNLGEGQFYFDAFHVGQGMCSVVHNNNIGIMLDAGAGKPITKPA